VDVQNAHVPLTIDFALLTLAQDLEGMKLLFQVMDFDQMSADDFIGECWIDLKKDLVPDVLGRQQFSGIVSRGPRMAIPIRFIYVEIHWTVKKRSGLAVGMFYDVVAFIGNTGSIVS
jgi:hypothetical protein